MKYRPILFNTPMVIAILEGRKTKTRRIVRLPDEIDPYRAEPSYEHWETLDQWDFLYGVVANIAVIDSFYKVKAPYAIGDILWVRETWMPVKWAKPEGKAIPADWKENGFMYYATDEIRNSDGSPVIWKPSIHMPKEAARIFLLVTDVRAERLHDITDREAEEEGIGNLYLEDVGFGNKDYGCIYYSDTEGYRGLQKEQFAHLWDSTIRSAYLTRNGWEANPWVWVYSFERIEKPEGWPHV